MTASRPTRWWRTWRSADAIERFKSNDPARPVVLQLSGTDIYHYLDADRIPTLRSMELADRLVALNDLAWRVVPKGSAPASASFISRLNRCHTHIARAPAPWSSR